LPCYNLFILFAPPLIGGFFWSWRLYQLPFNPHFKQLKLHFLLFAALAILIACSPLIDNPKPEIPVSLIVDGLKFEISLPENSTVRDAIEGAQIEIDLLDRSEPSLSTLITPNLEIQFIRVEEIFDTEEEILPFERQILQNESLEEGTIKLVQSGENGLIENTYRNVYEDGEKISRTLVFQSVIAEPIEEIQMRGVQISSSSLLISGKIAYLSGGSAWLIEGSSQARRPLLTTGDLDGRIFSLSPNGDWLLFSRESESADEINSLWLINTREENNLEIDLRTGSVVHFANWLPQDNQRLAFSTVESSINPPGWLANNDLHMIRINNSGSVIDRKSLLSPQSDSLYSWWGFDFAFSPNAEQILYSAPDEIGLVDQNSDSLVPLIEVIPFQTGSDWAWQPSASWDPDSEIILTIQHAAQSGLINQEKSSLFDLVSYDLASGDLTVIAENIGMFGNPQISPEFASSGVVDSELLGYLQAYNPSQSDISPYQLLISSIDGTSSKAVFPPSGAPGLIAQPIIWSPEPQNADQGLFLSIIYQGNLWIVNPFTGLLHQITSDGLISRVDWGQ
jgi:hypothetical protein